jgi:HD-GYP domain-containing protein (c-di-GMP phosphodiesterase class II)/PAS domain-containing protein
MHPIAGISRLFAQLDSCTSFEERADRLTAWVTTLPTVASARLLCTDRVTPTPTNESILRLSPARGRELPDDVAVVNGIAAALPDAFPEAHRTKRTVVVPFTDRDGEGAGAVLINSTTPRLFVRRYGNLLRIVGSKVRDMTEIAWLRRPGTTEDLMTPAALGALLNVLGMPMYARSPSGRFIVANQRFLDEFHFVDLEELNARPEVFLREEPHRFTQDAPLQPVLTTIRGGDDRVWTVHDYAMVMGGAVLGVAVDVTDYLNATARLQDALAAQTNLAEKLTATTTVLQKTQATAMKSLAKLAEYRDKETGGHLLRICEYMKLLAIDLRTAQPFSFPIAEDYIDDIYLSGMLHDIGKVGVPDQVLLKPGPLSSDEWVLMKKHTNWGYSILSQADRELGEQSFLTLASQIALHHHEWYDGSGYPVGSSGEHIPLSARIGALADVYDALTSRRPYKDAWAHDRAVEEIRSLRGTHFDPAIVDIFLNRESAFSRVRQRFPDDGVPMLN